MGSAKKSQVGNKFSSNANEDWSDKDKTNANKRKIRKRKLSDVLGSQWSKEDLECFYEAYRRYGKNWKKVAAVMRNRSADMVEALYNMNRAYLSLPEGAANAAGLIAMMTDNYNILDGSDDDQESNRTLRTFLKPKQCVRRKPHLDMPKGYEGSQPDYLQKQSAPSNSGCLALLKNHSGDLFGGNQPRAVGKRTPRFPVPFLQDNNERHDIMSSKRHDLKFRVDDAAADGVHMAALALAEASQRGGPSQISETFGRKVECVRSSPMWSGKTRHAESHVANPDYNNVRIDGNYVEGSLGSREADNRSFTNYAGILDIEGTGASKIQRKVNMLQEKKSKGPLIEIYQSDDARKACSGDEKGHDVRDGKHEVDTEIRKQKTAMDLQGLIKKSHELFSQDEIIALDALLSLADLSMKIPLPDPAFKSESSKHANEQRSVDSAFTSNLPGSMLTKQESDESRILVIKDMGCSSNVEVHVVHQNSAQKNLLSDENSLFHERKTDYPAISGMSKRKRKCPPEMVLVEEGKNSSVGQTPGCSSLIIDLGRRAANFAESNPQVSATNHPSMPARARNRRKINLQKAMAQMECKFSDSIIDRGLSKCSHSVDSKEKLSHCLSLQMFRSWCAFEWFYSAIDYPWFARSEYVEYLNYVRLSHVSRLTRCEWSIVRSSLGKSRRLSKQFLLEERDKLNQYRELVRTCYDELHAGVREGLPTDLAPPLSVGQRVIARHPKKGEIHDGSILTVGRDRCMVQFDRPDLGVELVMDIDCMPENPWENVPEDLRKQCGVDYESFNSFTDKQPDGHMMELKMSNSRRFSPKKSLQVADGTSINASTIYPLVALNDLAKGDMKDDNALGKYSATEVAVVAQHTICAQPCTLTQMQEKEADIRALAELSHVLEKKEALLNDKVVGKEKDGDSVRDSGHFRKKDGMVPLQLQEASDQVGSPLLVLRQCNTFHGISTSPLHRSMENSGLAGCPGFFSTYDLYNQDTGSHVVKLVENSRSKARKMVDVAVQAMSTLKDGEDAVASIGEALESKNNQYFGTESGNLGIRYIHHPRNDNLNTQDQAVACLLQPATTRVHSPQVQFLSANAQQIPTELISSCVATFLMIQACTERRYPPADVAQILDHAVKSLQPRCSENLPIYREIETYMGFIKSQMLALIPSSSTSSRADVSV